MYELVIFRPDAEKLGRVEALPPARPVSRVFGSCPIRLDPDIVKQAEPPQSSNVGGNRSTREHRVNSSGRRNT